MFALTTRRWPSVALKLTRLSLPRLSAAASLFSTDASTKEKLIHKKLTERFSPRELHIEDVSGGCGTFFAITIASEAFKGISTVKQHQLVQRTIKEEIEEIHGLQIKTTH